MTDAFETHDHAACQSVGVARADQICAERGLRLTPIRRRVLELLLEEHRARGAYDILDRLRAEKLGSQPPVVYRALDFLTAHGFAHRIESLNAFVACAHPHGAHSPVFQICTDCHQVAELPSGPIREKLAEMAQESGFQMDQTNVEVTGLCPMCQASS